MKVKPPPRHPPSRLASTADLRRLQRMMARAIIRPLGRRGRLAASWIDGRPMGRVASEFIKPNDRLTARDRLEIYSRMYWARILESMAEDCPGLRAALGERKFQRLARAYLAKYPSRSFTLRNLCSRLPRFIREEPAWTAPRTDLAFDLARFEWAQTVAFDGPSLPPLDPTLVANSARRSSRLRLRLQPYLTLLSLGHPLDDFVIAVKRRQALRSEASNAIERFGPAGRGGARRAGGPGPVKIALPAPRRTHLAVHRLDGDLYYKRLDPAEYRILRALGAGRTLGRALEAGGRRLLPDQVRQWFANWMKFGWLCPPQT